MLYFQFLAAFCRTSMKVSLLWEAVINDLVCGGFYLLTTYFMIAISRLIISIAMRSWYLKTMNEELNDKLTRK